MKGRKLATFWIKLRHWEFWPFGVLQFPVFFYYAWLALKSRSFFFFSASNPSILSGGMLGESKFDVLQLIPESVKPTTILIRIPAAAESVLEQLKQAGLKFPMIFKPDLGERGWMVRRIENESDIRQYLQEIRINFIAQAFVALPLEFGVFYVRYPMEKSGRVTSITGKEMLAVTGDGVSTLSQLIARHERALLQWDSLQLKFAREWDTVLPAQHKVELVSIGNHCLGTKFLNQNELINDRLTDSFDQISKQIPGFYFGRFDLRCATRGDLEDGKVMILELNGCGAEPAHIYQPGASLFSAIGTLLRHWKTLYEISAQNHALGTPYMTLTEARAAYRQFNSRM